MNMEVAQGIAYLNGFVPFLAECNQAHIEAAITSTHQQFAAARANGMPTQTIENQIGCLKNELDAIYGNI